MPFDGSVVAAIQSELEPIALQGRIDKVYQPEPDELILTFRQQKNNFRLLLSAHNQYPRVQIIETPRENPSQPPAFCMLLRKHLIGGRLTRIEQPDFDRRLVFHIHGNDDLNQLTYKQLIVEMMGKHSNIILVDGLNQQILDSIKRIPLHISRKRQVLPGLLYESPPSTKVSPLMISSESDFYQTLEQANDIQVKNALMSRFNGLSPMLTMEIIHRSTLDHQSRWNDLSINEQRKLYGAFRSIMLQIKNGQFNPMIFQLPDSGKYQDFSVIPLTHLQHWNSFNVVSPSQMLEEFYGRKNHQDRLHQRSHDLRKIVTIKRNRLTHKMQNFLHDEEKAQRSTRNKKIADLIMANLGQIPPGSASASVIDYYHENQPSTAIQLDPKMTPSQNAQQLYKKYQKAKTALQEISRQRIKTKYEIQYLDQVIHTLEEAETLQDLDVIREELVENGYLKRKATGKKIHKQLKSSQPLTYHTSANHTIRVGKNNLQNEMLTFQLSKKNHLWFHVKDLPGSHVVLMADSREVTAEEIKQAALLAAYYSKGRQSSNVPVDYTLCRNVRKQRSSRPGMVIYDNHQTIFVTPDESAITLLDKEE